MISVTEISLSKGWHGNQIIFLGSTNQTNMTRDITNIKITFIYKSKPVDTVQTVVIFLKILDLLGYKRKTNQCSLLQLCTVVFSALVLGLDITIWLLSAGWSISIITWFILVKWNSSLSCESTHYPNINTIFLRYMRQVMYWLYLYILYLQKSIGGF